MYRWLFLMGLLCPALVFAAAPAKPFELRDGDRVVFLGDTLMEREKDFGYIELMMTLRFPDRNITFRNLGWSADTPVGISRVSFDWPKGEAEMFRVLMEQVRQVQPTVVVLGYGMASSLEDAAATEMERRTEMASASAGEDRVPPHPSPLPQGEGAAASRAASKPGASIGQETGERSPLSPGERAGVRGKGASENSQRLEKFKRDYEKLIDAILELNKETRFILLSPIRHEKLPPPLPDPARHNEFLANYTKAIQGIAEKRGFHFANLFDGIPFLAKETGQLTDNGIHLNAYGYSRVAEFLGVAAFAAKASLATIEREDLRQAIIAKNQLFFHRWRPENSTYLFLFRKHEQGKNAQEIPKFDPLIEAEEKKIATLRKQPPQDPSPGQLARKPSQNPLPEHPATPKKDQPRPTFILADPNLEVTLWAENPLLAKPIAMNWDARGRLWIASSSVYPQIEPGQAQDDKILILEDTNGDGKADKTTVFADGLLIPTGIEPGDGGCYVGQSTELLHFKDTDGDGIADQRRVVLSGFGTEDTHHILHTLRWGPDGQLYMNQSIYIHSHIETPHGVVRLNSGGTLALRPDTLELGVTMKGLVNGWGHVWDDFGQEFQTDGAGGAGLNWNFPQATFLTYEGARRIIGSVSPGSYPKFCGLELIKSERFPKEWQGNAVTLDFRANRMVRFEILDEAATETEGRAPRVPDQNNNRNSVQDAGNQSGTRGARPSKNVGGAGYTTRQHEFLRSTNVTFRPIDVKLGPDGALYIADWSNPIIQHGEVDFRDPRRDREHGRIWRVGYKGGKDVKAPELVKGTSFELLKQLASPNAFNREKAERLLIERAADSKSSGETISALHLYTLNGVAKFRTNQSDGSLLNAVWMYQALDRPNEIEPFVKRVSESSDHRLRAAAMRAIGALVGNTPSIPSLARARIDYRQANSDERLLNVLDVLTKGVADDHPRVRIEALRALARIPTARAAELALSVLDAPRSSGRESAPSNSGGNDQSRLTSAATNLDPWLEYALWLTINDLAEPWAAAVESGAWRIEGRENQLHYALKAIEPKLATRLMAKVIGDKPLPRDGSGGMIELIGQAGGPAQLRKLFDQALSGGFTDEATAQALNQLTEAARLRNAKPSGDLSAIANLLTGRADRPLSPQNGDAQQRVPTGAQAAAAKLTGSWKLASLAPALSKTASDTSLSVTVRQASIEGLRDLDGRNSITALRSLVRDKDTSIQRFAAAALAATDLNGSMPQILEVVSATTKEEDALALWRSLLAPKDASPALAKSLATTSLPESVARAGLRVAREGGRSEPNLVLALNRAGGISDPTAALTDEEIHMIAYEVTKGDPANGEKLYRSKQLGCMMCHSIGGAGGKVGPDLTSLGASTPLADYLVESVLLPNKKVKEGFNSVQITTRDDEDIAGNLVREDSEQVVLRDATNKEISVPKRNIKERKMGGSLMPAGLLDFISPQERLDVYAFLAQLGKPGPYDATKQNVARVWRLNPKVGTVNADEMLKSDIRTSKDWTPINATVSGTLPKSEIMEELQGQDATVWVASRFQTAKSGATKFKISGTPSPKAWIDGKPIGGDSDLTVDLPAGQHTFFLKVTTSDIAQGLKLESDDVTFLVE